MTNKLVGLGALVLAFAFFQYLFLPRSLLAPHVESPVSLPRSVGSFHATRRWSDRLNLSTVAVDASYRSSSGAQANLEIWLGSRTAHNGIGCWLVRGYPLLWQRLRSIRMANASVIFDTALLRDDKGLVLLANTECRPAGCRESLVPEGIGFRMPVFSEPAPAITPISILVRQLDHTAGESAQAQGARLVQSFESFAEHLDLRSLLAPSVSQGADEARGTGEHGEQHHDEKKLLS